MKRILTLVFSAILVSTVFFIKFSKPDPSKIVGARQYTSAENQQLLSDDDAVIALADMVCELQVDGGNPSQYDNLDLFVREQERMKELVEQSILPSLTLDVSDNDVAGATERIADWMESNGGLYMSD